MKKARKSRASGETTSDGFQDKLLGMLEWLADKDPVRAAKLIGEYLDDLSKEMGAKPVKS